MHFDFDQDRLLFRDSVRALLAKECTPERLRELAASDSGRSRELWATLGEVGLLGVRVPQEHGGLGLDELDLVLALEESGRAGLAEPLVESAAIAAPLIAELGSESAASRWLPPLAAGEEIATIGHARNAFVADAHVANLVLLQRGDEIHAVLRDEVTLAREESIDPLRRLFTVMWTSRPETCLARGERAQALMESAFDRGALATAAQQLGVAQRLLETAVQYACTREQFGQAIGAFQAIKHMLANVAVRLEFARPVVYRAAWSVAHGTPERPVAVSHAKAAASEAATLAAKTALQVHGAIGYTWEVDLHLWMKRAWSLDLAWGSAAWHRQRIARRLFDSQEPAPSFGFSARKSA